MIAMEEHIIELMQQATASTPQTLVSDVVDRSQLLEDSERDFEEGR